MKQIRGLSDISRLKYSVGRTCFLFIGFQDWTRCLEWRQLHIYFFLEVIIH